MMIKPRSAICIRMYSIVKGGGRFRGNRQTGNASLILESDDELEEKARRTAATLNEDVIRLTEPCA